jgi:hypothetical protein
MDARLNGSDLSETFNLSPEQVESAELDRATQLPPYLEINWKGKGDYEVTKKIEKKSKRKKTKKKS